ncbi:MAG: hypothetical protein DHS20C21_10590 [Gemmatimonadota bacterium]|nr:MAG: hypothetical protein DHS20C21_10590 [Gemmatimonadota bacterium]
MKRAVIAVVVGYLLWTAVWLGGNALLFGELAAAVQAGERHDVAGPLVGVLALSVACSLLAGIAAARLATGAARSALLTLGVLLLLTGIGVQAGVWSLMPVWYHLLFLALLIPGVLVGGRLAGSRAG